MDKRKIQAPMVGGSSLLVIFAVLCLTVFALLGFSTVQADMRLSDASAEAVSDYYAAEAEAERILAELRSGEAPEGVSAENDVYTYTCRISDTQVLAVAVRINEEEWQILRWQAVSTAHTEEDSSLNVWDGSAGS